MESNEPQSCYFAALVLLTPPYAVSQTSPHGPILNDDLYDPVNRVSSSRRYSPTSACLNAATPVGSNFLISPVDRAVMPNPSGVSDMLSTMTP